MRNLLPLLGILACTPSFQAPSDVSDLRVLAVEADPPEAQFDAQGNVADVHLRVLAVDPYRDGFAAMDSALCAPSDSRRCDSGPRFDLPPASRQGGTEFSATVPGALMGPLIAYALSSDALKGLGGIRVMFSLAVSDGDPNGPILADKILLYSPAGTPPNHNPLLTGLAVTADGVPVATIDPSQTLELKLGVKYGLRPLLAEGAREEYDTTDLKGNTVHLTEDPSYAFFVSPGAEVDRDNATEPQDGIAPPDGFTRIDAFRAGTGTLWVVVRDGRGGESWIAVAWHGS